MFVLQKCIVVALCMTVPAVLLCDIYTSPTSRSISLAAFKASHFQARLVFRFLLSGGWTKRQARGHVDPPDPER